MSAKVIYVIGSAVIVGTIAWLLASEGDKGTENVPVLTPEPTPAPVPAPTPSPAPVGATATPIPIPAPPAPVPEPTPPPVITPIPVPTPPAPEPVVTPIPAPVPTPPPVITPIPVPAPVPTYTPPALMADGNLPWELVTGGKIRLPFLPAPWRNINVRDTGTWSMDFQPTLPPYGYYWPTWRAPVGPEGQRRYYFIIGVQGTGIAGSPTGEDRVYIWAGDSWNSTKSPKAVSVLLNEIQTSTLYTSAMSNAKFILDYNGNLIWGTL